MKKIILISGATSGLGKAAAALLSKKHTVIVSSHNAEETEAVAKELGVDFVVIDVTNYEQIKTAVAQVINTYGTIDCLVNNAGIWFEGSLEKNDPLQIKRLFDINTLGTIWLTHAVLPYMKKVKTGRIVNVISQSGISAKSDRSIYNASKWAITGFTKCLQEELKKTGVTVCGIYPGKVKTKIFEKSGYNMDVSNALEIEEVVRAIEYILQTPDNAFISELGIRSNL